MPRFVVPSNLACRGSCQPTPSIAENCRRGEGTLPRDDRVNPHLNKDYEALQAGKFQLRKTYRGHQVGERSRLRTRAEHPCGSLARAVLFAVQSAQSKTADTSNTPCSARVAYHFMSTSPPTNHICDCVCGFSDAGQRAGFAPNQTDRGHCLR